MTLWENILNLFNPKTTKKDFAEYKEKTDSYISELESEINGLKNSIKEMKKSTQNKETEKTESKKDDKIAELEKKVKECENVIRKIAVNEQKNTLNFEFTSEKLYKIEQLSEQLDMLQNEFMKNIESGGLIDDSLDNLKYSEQLSFIAREFYDYAISENQSGSIHFLDNLFIKLGKAENNRNEWKDKICKTCDYFLNTMRDLKSFEMYSPDLKLKIKYFERGESFNAEDCEKYYFDKNKSPEKIICSITPKISLEYTGDNEDEQTITKSKLVAKSKVLTEQL